MPKSPEQFDFSKVEDQQKFEKLSENVQEKIIKESQEEGKQEDQAREIYPDIARLERKSKEIEIKQAENIRNLIQENKEINSYDIENAAILYIRIGENDKAKEMWREAAEQKIRESKYSGDLDAAEICLKFGDYQYAKKYAEDAIRGAAHFLNDADVNEEINSDLDAFYYNEDINGVFARAFEILNDIDIAQHYRIESIKDTESTDALLFTARNMKNRYGEGDFYNKILEIIKNKKNNFNTNISGYSVGSAMELCRMVGDERKAKEYLNDYINKTSWVYPEQVKLSYAKELGLNDEEIKEMNIRAGEDCLKGYKRDAEERKIYGPIFASGKARDSIKFYLKAEKIDKAREVLKMLINDKENPHYYSDIAFTLSEDEIGSKLLNKEELINLAENFERDGEIDYSSVIYQLAGEKEKAVSFLERKAEKFEKLGNYISAAYMYENAADCLKKEK